MSIPRSEYPRPQFVRDDWLCLNGQWRFEIDSGDSGLERGLLERDLNSTITVPFPPESSLSGINNTDFMNAVWYRREIKVPSGWAGMRVLLHFQGVDYDTTVWANGIEVGRHRGGFAPFTCDLSQVVSAGETVTIVVRARDDRDSPQPRGKQSTLFDNYGCLYTRTTGIWQTVWMEPVPQTALERPRITPDVSRGLFRIEQTFVGMKPGITYRASLYDSQGFVCAEECNALMSLSVTVALAVGGDRKRLWSPEDPHLYDIQLELLDEKGSVIDKASSYAGLRSVAIDGKRILINGRCVFQRLVLDQGYYPDGIMTAPTDEALRRDIELSMAAGFNGARLHQKVFEERFLFHADRMGYLVWGEFGDWGCRNENSGDSDCQHPGATYITQWLEVLARDYSHPCIIGWCPLNETAQRIDDSIRALDDITRGMFLATKAFDTTRPVLDTSGYSHRVAESDIYDCHDYAQAPEELKANQELLSQDTPFMNGPKDSPWSIPYRGQPFFVSEFGGIWWNPDAGDSGNSWGYGERPKSIEEFYERFEGLCGALLDNPLMFGYCYTQLTDVFQEQNGIYTFSRKAKFDVAKLAEIQGRKAAIEP